MEPREFLDGAVVVVCVAGAGALAGLAGGTAGALAGATAGALAGATVYNNFKKQQEEQSLLTNGREESREYNPDHHSYSTVQERTLQRQQQTQTPREELRQPYPNPPSPTVQAPPTQRITKQYLVLVVSASQADLLESLQTKRRIDFSDGEALYEITKYLWLGSETDLNQRIASINQYLVSKGEESEYDIYLVYIELNQADDRFKSNVDQVDRYDAFRNLADADLEVKFEISRRLQMEAYGNFDVYNR